MEFIESLWDPSRFEFSSYDYCYNLDNALSKNDNMFFLWEVEKPKISVGRETWDAVIIAKKYLAIDLDIRNDYVKSIAEWEWKIWKKLSKEEHKKYMDKHGNEITDNDIKELWTQIKNDIQDVEYFNEWSYFVFTGNWLHIYYIWDYIENIDIELYKAGQERIYENFNKIFENKYWKEIYISADPSTANIARILRLPWTKNWKDKNNPKTVEIIFEQKSHSRFLKLINDLWKKHIIEKERREWIIIKTEKKMRKIRSEWMKITTQDIVDLIWTKDIYEVLDYCWISYSHNRIYSWSILTNWWRIKRDENYVVNFNESADRPDWWPYSFVMKHLWYDTGKTINWFCERYSDVKDLVEKEDKQYKESKKEKNIDRHQPIDVDTEYFRHITTGEKLDTSLSDLMSTDPKKIIKRWREERDNFLWWIYWWKLYVVGAESWTWKTTFVNNVVRNVATQWWKIIRYSLEDKMTDQWKEEIYDELNRRRVRNWKKWYDRVKFYNWEYNSDEEFRRECKDTVERLKKYNIVELERKRQVRIEDLVALMEEACKNWANMFTIDHLHYFDMSWDERHDLQIQNTMQCINDIAWKYNVAVFIVAHYRNNTHKEVPHPSQFKDGAAIKQVANIVIQLVSLWEWISAFHITKLRRRQKWDREFRCEFNYSTWQLDFKKTESQKNAESIF